MKKTAVVYWSGTGNTEAMALAVLDGMKEAGAEAEIFTASEFNPDKINDYESFPFGCPSMGCEQLEDTEFEPMFDECKASLSGKSIALFGSYGWGNGEWMETWEDDCRSVGANLVCDSVICNDAPDDEAIEKCKNLGKALA